MLSTLTDAEKGSVWADIEKQLQQFESGDGFIGPCEMVVAVGEKP